MAHRTRQLFTRGGAAALALVLVAAGWTAGDAEARGSSRGSGRAAGKRGKVDWPNPTKAKRALAPRNFKKNIVDPALASASVVPVSGGREAFALGGAFGTVFKVEVKPQRFIAFRVFHPDSPSAQRALESGKVQRRYKTLERKFNALAEQGQLPPELIDFEYVSRGFKVGKRTFPAIKMPWLTAQPLDSWVRGRLEDGKPEALKIMARNWRRAMMDLDRAGVAHGDLRDANVLVEGDGTMRFVDYDAMYTEELAGESNSELGHPNYQHPEYHRGDGTRKRPYNRKLDNFSSIVVYLSLLAVAEDPGLWDRHNDDFQLIFSKEDLADPDSSPVFDELGRSPSAAVRKLSSKLASYAKGSPDQVPSLEEALGTRTAGKGARKPAIGRRETGGVMVDQRVTSEGGGDAYLARRLGVRSRRALGSVRTGEQEPAPAGQSPEGDGAAPAVATTRGQSARGQSARGQSARGQSARSGRFAQVVPLIDGPLPRVSTGNPGLLLLLTDSSSSMNEQFAGQTGIRKADALAEVVNQTLAELVGRFRSGDRVKDTMDVAAYTYSGSEARPALDGPLAGRGIVNLPELADGVQDLIEDVDDNGEPFTQPIWVQPRSGGRTPMTRGFGAARNALGQWRQQRNPQREHLVLAVHVTDGQSTDGDPSPQISALAREVEAQNGKLLLTNIHLSSSGDPSQGVVFPTEADAARFDQFGQRLFEQSSVVPEPLRQKLNRMGRNVPRGARMMAYNASVEDLAFLFEAGSSTAIE